MFEGVQECCIATYTMIMPHHDNFLACYKPWPKENKAATSFTFHLI